MAVTGSMDDVQRLFRHLVKTLAQESPARLRAPLQIADIYQNVMPYRICKAVLRFDTNQDYEMALLRLLAGEHGYVTTEPGEIQGVLREEADSVNPDPGAFRDYAAAMVFLSANAVRHVLDEREVYAPPEPPSAVAAFPPGSHPDVAPPQSPTPAPTSPVTIPRPPTPLATPRPGPTAASTQHGTAKPAAQPVRETRDSGGSHRCPHCFEFLPSDRTVVFCPFCGRNVKAIECPQCNEALEPGWKYCITCGQSVMHG